MLDLIKFKIIDEDSINRIWNNEQLIYDGKFEKLYIDEIKEQTIKKYKNLYFTKFQNRLEVNGSLHYFFNDGIHNANDFFISNSIDTLNELKNRFQLDLNNCFLVNLEYGVNIIPNYPVKELVDNLAYHEKRQFIKPLKHQYYKIAGLDAYKQAKAYNKGVQFPNHCDINTFRFEIKSKQAKFINNLGLFTLNDLTIQSNYLLLINSLINEWDKVLVFDTSKEIDIKFFNTHFWEQTIKANNRNKFNNQKRIYNRKLGENNLHSNIKNLIFLKTQQLYTVQFPSL